MDKQYDIDNYILGNETKSTGVWHELALSQTWNSVDALHHMKNAFKAIDVDDNGFLSQSELTNVVESNEAEPESRLLASAMNRVRESLSGKSNDEWGTESEISQADLDEMIARVVEPNSAEQTEIKETMDEARFQQASLAIGTDSSYIDKDGDGALSRTELESGDLPHGVQGTADFLKFNYSRLHAMTAEISTDSKLDGALTMLNLQADDYRNPELFRHARVWGWLAAASAAYSGCELGVVPAYAAGAAGSLAGGLLYRKIMRNYMRNLQTSFASLSYPDTAEK